MGISFSIHIVKFVMEVKIPEFARQSSVEVLTSWIQYARHINNLPTEYHAALELMAVNRDLLQKSSTERSIDVLAPIVDAGIEENEIIIVIRQCITLAYDKYENISCVITGVNIETALMKIYDSFNWRKRYFHAGLQILAENISKGDMMILLAELCRVSSLCKAAKRFGFLSVMNRVAHDFEKENEREEESQEEKSATELVIRYLKNEYLPDYCYKAFRAAFIEAAVGYFKALDSASIYPDILEQHGANIFAATVTATTGIPLPIAALDEVNYGGTCRYLDCTDPSYLVFVEALLHPDNFGRSYRDIPEFSSVVITDEIRTQSFIFQGANTREKALNAMKHDVNLQPERLAYTKYLMNFMRLFSKDFFVQKCITSLSQIREHQMNQIFGEMKESGVIECEEDDFRYWVWDVLTGEMNLDHAAQILHYMEVIV